MASSPTRTNTRHAPTDGITTERQQRNTDASAKFNLFTIMSKMEYHEIGERFEHDGAVLEVTEWTEDDGCYDCYFHGEYPCPDWCNEETKFILVEQCKPKDMKQRTEIKVEGTDKVFATHKVNIQSDEDIYGSLLDKLFTTYKAKNKDYGRAFTEMFDELGIDYAYGKLREKINRIKVLRKQPNMVENEGLEDALLDTAGYAILTLVELKKRKE